MEKQIRVSSLEEVKKELHKLEDKQKIAGTNWSPYKVFVHCSKTIEYSMTGYPSLKPAFIRATIGKIAIKKFLSQGYMKHDLMADVPGSPEIKEIGTADDGVKALIQTIEKFQAYQGALKPHLIFGNLTKNQYDQYFAIHIADHLSEIVSN